MRDIAVFDDVLSPESQQEVLNFLALPGWAFGAYSDSSPGASRYWYKHFAGFVRDGSEDGDPQAFAAALGRNAPPVSRMWRRLERDILAGHRLTRCYANGYPSGAEGGLHLDSNIDSHFTAIYYPHLSWHANWAGETVFFDKAGQDIIASVYPRPNRLVVFRGTIPHVARGVSRACPELRVTLMFKTMT
ncbi:MAG: 2OG-Fe(II) oxygenase [Caulobacteraceae bacterium]